MSDQQLIIPRKKLLIFIGIVVATLGIVVYIVAASPDNEGSVLERRDVDGTVVNTEGFLGEKGGSVNEENGKIYINESDVNDGGMHPFNFYSQESNKTIYFFIIKASDGTYRTAANACEVCFGSKKGFKQVGTLIRCENCRVTYPKDKIALEKGGCNPGPIDKDVPLEDGKLVINSENLEKVAYLF